jgi:hypothetical protein
MASRNAPRAVLLTTLYCGVYFLNVVSQAIVLFNYVLHLSNTLTVVARFFKQSEERFKNWKERI